MTLDPGLGTTLDSRGTFSCVSKVCGAEVPGTRDGWGVLEGLVRVPSNEWDSHLPRHTRLCVCECVHVRT